MRSRLTSLFAALALAVVLVPGHFGGVSADGVCPMGSNWDNSIQACK